MTLSLGVVVTFISIVSVILVLSVALVVLFLVLAEFEVH